MHDPPSAGDDPLWTGLDRYIASAPDAHTFAGQGIGPLVAWRLREAGQLVPQSLEEIARRSAYGTVTAVPLLQRIQAALDAPIIVLKGPEVAARYPHPALRPYGDLDILVPDVDCAERQLVDAGFELLGTDFDVLPGMHHDRPLKLKGTVLAVELHRAPGWLPWMNPPTNQRLFTIAVPSITGVDGVLTLPPLEHTLYLAVHTWRHGPVHSLLHLIDIALMQRLATSSDLENTAHAWQIDRIWRHLTSIIDHFLHEPESPLAPIQRLWTHHIRQYRARRYWEQYLSLSTRGLAAPTVPDRAVAITRDVLSTFTLNPGETPRSVATHIAYRLRHANQPATPKKRR